MRAHTTLSVGLAIVAVVQAASLYRMRGDLRELAAQLRSQRQLGSVPVEDATTEAQLPALLAPDRPTAAPELDEAYLRNEIRAMVADEIMSMREQQTAVAEQSREEAQQRIRAAVAQELALTSSDLQTLEGLGARLMQQEQAMFNGTAPDPQAQQLLAAERQRAEAQIKDLLGDARFAKLQAARLQHPEFGRALYVLRAHLASPPTDLPGAGAVAR